MRGYTKSSNALDVFFVQEILKIDNITCNDLSCTIIITLVPRLLTSRVIVYSVWLSRSPVPHARTLALALRGSLDLVRGCRDSEFETFGELQVWQDILRRMSIEGWIQR